MKQKPILGALEYCSLPQLGIKQLAMRVDTGATTSSLHVDNIEEIPRDDDLYIRFDIHPDIHDVNKLIRCEAQVIGQKQVKSSTATRERRYLINTQLEVAEQTWQIQLTLTDRSEMTYLMLLGREAMSGHFMVDPEFEFLLTSAHG